MSDLILLFRKLSTNDHSYEALWKRTLLLSAFIFNALDSGDGVGAPNCW
jgi:hypothetical protein